MNIKARAYVGGTRSIRGGVAIIGWPGAPHRILGLIPPPVVLIFLQLLLTQQGKRSRSLLIRLIAPFASSIWRIHSPKKDQIQKYAFPPFCLSTNMSDNRLLSGLSVSKNTDQRKSFYFWSVGLNSHKLPFRLQNKHKRNTSASQHVD
jgi:hypothetical protein